MDGYCFFHDVIFGVIALTGVVVNDSLILTDAVNKRLSAQQSMSEAVIGACKQRFRPILITSLTTFFGLFPLLLENSLQAQEICLWLFLWHLAFYLPQLLL